MVCMLDICCICCVYGKQSGSTFMPIVFQFVSYCVLNVCHESSPICLNNGHSMRLHFSYGLIKTFTFNCKRQNVVLEYNQIIFEILKQQVFV